MTSATFFSCLSLFLTNVVTTNGFSASSELKHSPWSSNPAIFACSRFRLRVQGSKCRTKQTILHQSLDKNEGSSSSIIGGDESLQRRIVAASLDDPVSLLNVADEKASKQDTSSVINGGKTVNARLLDELNNSIAINKNPEPKIKALKSIAGFFTSTKTEEERQRALEEARDLNGVNSLACLAASLFCFAFAAGLWVATNVLIELFVMHPLPTEIYAIQRFASVVRNVVVGITSLGAGFSAVTGLGLAALGIRVAYGVYVTGELDPTPTSKSFSRTSASSPSLPEFSDQEGSDKFDAREAFALMFGDNKKRRRQK
jgi:hypothetical protein